MTLSRVVISGTGLFTPTETITNEALVASFNAFVERENARNQAAIERGEKAALAPSSVEFIEKASGIKQRFVLNREGILDPERMCPHIPERPNSELSVQAEMAVAAATEALAQAHKTAADIDVVIVACSNLGRAYPAIAIEVQNALGIRGHAFDMNVACSSATFGIAQAVNAIRCNTARAVLVVNPEICSAHLDFRDRDCHFIFGDVCTAIVLERADEAKCEEPFEILGIELGTAFSNHIRNNFGFLNRCDESGIGARDKLFVQEGRKVFKEVVPMVAAHIASHLRTESIAPERVRRFWLHQANLSMNELIAKKVLGREATREEAPVVLDLYANTSSAGSVIAFHQHRADFLPDDVGVLASFGAGYSVGSVVLRRLPA
jgi:beta-ketodecanoyl-[acyl-carrier-protein] synthase